MATRTDIGTSDNGMVDLREQDSTVETVSPIDQAAEPERIAPDHRLARDTRRQHLVGYTIRVMLATLLLAAIILVASLNADEVRLDLVSDRVDVPVWAIISASAGAGLLLGLLVPRRSSRH